jgi:hypothetical protein
MVESVNSTSRPKGMVMIRITLAAVVALVATGVGLAAATGSSETKSPTTASLTPAYVQAAKYWQHHHIHSATDTRTASLTPEYVQAAKYWQHHHIGYATATRTASLTPEYVQAAKYWQHPHHQINRATATRRLPTAPTTASPTRAQVQAAEENRR